MKKMLSILSLAGLLVVGACSDADVVSHNISKDADYFRVNRRVVFFNGITDSYLLVVEGYCSLGNDDRPKTRSVTCKVGPNEYKKHYFGLADNATYFAEQIDAVKSNPYHYKVIFKPSVLAPSIEVR